MNIRLIIEKELNNIKSDLDIKTMYGWYNTFKNRYYKDITRVITNHNNQYGNIFGIDDPNYVIDNKPELINIKDYISSDKYFDHNKRIESLSNMILKNMEFEPIVVEPNKKYVIEGQHRIRAIKKLGMKTILAYKIIDKDN